MLLFVGLGNPGSDFQGTRHNTGREIAFALQKRVKLPAFSFQKKWNAQISEGTAGREKIAVLLPETFMNKSGNAVFAASRSLKVGPKGIFVIHDDADIEFGKAKLSFAKRSAGHKGVESVMRALKTIDFWRFRIGIAGKRNIPAEKFILKKFTPGEAKTAKKVTKKTLEAIETVIKEGPEKAMNEYNK